MPLSFLAPLDICEGLCALIFCLAEATPQGSSLAVMMNLLRFSFLPKSTDLGLLILRLHLGICMLYLHGWDKLMKFSSAAHAFTSPIAQLPPEVAYGLMVFAEAGCSILLIVGLLTRFASLTLIINMSVAFFIAMKANPHSAGGELALLYLGGYLVLFVTGAGRFSADRQ